MPAVRSDPKYESIAQGAAVVDDYVLQEFLTDIIDSAPFAAAGNQSIQLVDASNGAPAPQNFSNGNGCSNPSKAVNGLRQWSLGSVDFTSLLNTPPVTADLMDLGPPVQIDTAPKATAKKTLKKKNTPQNSSASQSRADPTTIRTIRRLDASASATQTSRRRGAAASAIAITSLPSSRKTRSSVISSPSRRTRSSA